MFCLVLKRATALTTPDNENNAACVQFGYRQETFGLKVEQNVMTFCHLKPD